MTEMARHLRIRGRVQGVGFRWNLQQRARAAGLRGWVRNCRDGSVEALVCGSPSGLAQLMGWAVHGPSGAQVDQICIEDALPADQPHFAVLPEGA